MYAVTFLTSILVGLCMGSGALFSLLFGEKDFERLRRFVAQSFWMIGAVTLALCAAAFLWIDPVLSLLRVPAEVYGLLRGYLRVIFMGIPAVFLYNYFACLLRAVGDSLIPLVFLSISAVLNIALDLLFVAVWPMGVIGAAAATRYRAGDLRYWGFLYIPCCAALSCGFPAGICGLTLPLCAKLCGSPF